MPKLKIFKCVSPKCEENTVVYSDKPEEHKCDCATPKFLPVRKVCLIHKLGTGEYYGKAKNTEVISQGNENGKLTVATKVIETKLNVCCGASRTDVPGPLIATRMLNQITCPACRKFIQENLADDDN